MALAREDRIHSVRAIPILEISLPMRAPAVLVYAHSSSGHILEDPVALVYWMSSFLSTFLAHPPKKEDLARVIRIESCIRGWPRAAPFLSLIVPSVDWMANQTLVFIDYRLK